MSCIYNILDNKADLTSDCFVYVVTCNLCEMAPLAVKYKYFRVVKSSQMGLNKIFSFFNRLELTIG